MGLDLSRATGLADALRQHAADPETAGRPFLVFEDTSLSFAETLAEAGRYGNLFLRHRDANRPFHVGLLLENRPEFVLAQLGAFLAGAVVVGLNPTRRGAHLARDVTHAECRIVVTESKFAALLTAALEPVPAAERPMTLTATRWGDIPDAGTHGTSLEQALAAVPADDPRVTVAFDDLSLIVFTSGTTSAPKGVLRSHGRLLMFSVGAAFTVTQATADDAVYCVMPLFHANAQILGLGMALAAGCRLVLGRRFSKSRFLDDVRRHGCTLFNYVGSPLAYLMDTPPRADDADNPLRLAYGNEGPRQYLDAFARRFGCRVIDSYGASEVGVTFTREDGDPPGCLGRAAPEVVVMDEHGCECPPARFDAQGGLTNADEAIGEIVNTAGPGFFEGYWKNAEATSARLRDGHYHTGDLGYRDAAGFIYFAGRDAEWIRVEGENFLARPIEQILERHPDVFLAAAYAVPDAEAGDRVMAALALRPGAAFDGEAFARFLDAQADLSPKWVPTWLRVVPELHRSETNKVLKRDLQREKFLGVEGPDPLWWRPRSAPAYRPFLLADLAELRERFLKAGNLQRLDG